MSVLMRRARVTDLDRIMRLERATFTDDAWPVDAMRRELEGEHGYYLIAVDDDAAAGPAAGDRDADGHAGDAEAEAGAGASADATALDPSLLGYAGLLAPKGGEQGDVQTIAVAPAARGLGLGRGLMHALITEARRRGIAQLFLEVRADNAIARSLYRSLGFEEIGVRPRYYRHGIDAVLMRLDVPPAVTRPASGGADVARGSVPEDAR
ncbi:GNAT family N-acetyltransferase [Agromyces ramosus]|uniref:Ribosomal-protein-alanine N-acetyltransferase n=1 Tax=Agromyces ramosus TaxID=33879 RepID=A0ABU0R533_9MICO|nr:GNAT family N-acetyltransferase [Agromyces ramosus]MDQ0893195.1 ribosomal-protein-alanine N-acetyltransferase [Agromyces ramosus]